MALLIAILAGLPSAASFVMFHVVMVGIASSAYIEDRIRNMFGGSRRLH